MNALLVVFLSMGALVSAHWDGHDDGQWKGEGLAESQDWGQWDHGNGHWDGAHGAHGAWGHGAWAGHGYAHGWAHGAAPLGPDGRVVDTPEVAHAKAAHFAAKAAAGSHGAWAPAHGAWAGAAHGAWAPAHGAWAGAHGAWAHGVELTHDGKYLKDTPEVAHAKAAHFAAVAAASHGGHHYGPAYAHGHW